MQADLQQLCSRRPIPEPSAPSQLVKAFVVDPEMVGHLMEDGFADLFGELTWIARETQVFLPENADPVGSRRVVAHAAVLQHYPFVESQQPMPVSRLGWSRPILDHDVKVIDPLDYPIGQLGEDVVDDSLERGEVSPKGELGVTGDWGGVHDTRLGVTPKVAVRWFVAQWRVRPD